MKSRHNVVSVMGMAKRTALGGSGFGEGRGSIRNPIS